jgi:hypothetical protein
MPSVGRKVSTLRDLAERLTDGRLNVDADHRPPDRIDET